MPKMPIDWHEKCLRARKSSLDRAKARIEELIKVFERDEREYFIYEGQITRAKAESRDGFDADKFNKGRK